jgi:hypothetical protein
VQTNGYWYAYEEQIHPCIIGEKISSNIGENRDSAKIFIENVQEDSAIALILCAIVGAGPTGLVGRKREVDVFARVTPRDGGTDSCSLVVPRERIPVGLASPCAPFTSVPLVTAACCRCDIEPSVSTRAVGDRLAIYKPQIGQNG